MENNEKMTLEELEQLCRLFFDGSLSVSEEEDLSVVLSETSLRSKIIDEAIFIFGIEKVARNNQTAHSQSVAERGNDKNKAASEVMIGLRGAFRRILATSAVAASLIAILSVAWHTLDTGQGVAEPVYEVYENGKLVSDAGIAKKKALESYYENMRFVKEMKEMEQTQIAEMKRMINQKNNM